MISAQKRSIQALSGYVRSNDALFAESIYADRIIYATQQNLIDVGCLATCLKRRPYYACHGAGVGQEQWLLLQPAISDHILLSIYPPAKPIKPLPMQ